MNFHEMDIVVALDLTREELRIISAVELGQKNHSWVPIALIDHVASLPKGSTYTALKSVLKKKLVCYSKKEYDGYKLTTSGYDLLALKTLVNRIAAFSLKKQIGAGKESDIFELVNVEGKELVLKMLRLGNASFRSIKSKREYVQTRVGRSWLYFSRLAALKEFSCMRALNDYGFPVPFAIESNRHALLMSKIPGKQLVQFSKLMKPDFVYSQCMEILKRLISIGLVHGDFNEFNLIISDDETVVIIDFPQMVSISHSNAKMLFERDVDCINHFFHRINRSYFNYDIAAIETLENKFRLNFIEVAGSSGSLDSHLPVSNFKNHNITITNK
jgi:RIO kinase 2